MSSFENESQIMDSYIPLSPSIIDMNYTHNNASKQLDSSASAWDSQENTKLLSEMFLDNITSPTLLSTPPLMASKTHSSLDEIVTLGSNDLSNPSGLHDFINNEMDFSRRRYSAPTAYHPMFMNDMFTNTPAFSNNNPEMISLNPTSVEMNSVFELLQSSSTSTRPISSYKKPAPTPKRRRTSASLLPKKFQCTETHICNKMFARKHDMLRHAKTHLNVKEFLCMDCHKKFARNDALGRHRNGRCPVARMNASKGYFA